jgi:hypothetical protein
MKNIPQEPELLNLESNNIPITEGFLTLIYGKTFSKYSYGQGYWRF